MVAAKVRFVSNSAAEFASKPRGKFETNSSAKEIAAASGLDRTRVAYALVVLKYASDLVDSVISGATGLDAAYDVALQAGDRLLSFALARFLFKT